MTETAPPKRLGFPLGLGVFLFPIVFAWFTLRPGYSSGTRIAVFVWLVVNLAFAVLSVTSGR